MKPITQTLTEIFSDAFCKAGYDADLGAVTASDRPDLCQFQCSGALPGAKRYKKAPALIARDVVKELGAYHDLFAADIAAPGFINISVSGAALRNNALEIFYDPNTGIPQAVYSETVLLDYGGPNIAKPLHIGHLRPAILGEAFKNLLRATGRIVISDVHFGDWGLPMGLVIAELEDQHISVYDLTADILNELYPEASKRGKADPAFKHTAQKITAELQAGNPRYREIWKQIVKISVADLKAGYDRLGVSFDLWNGESDADRYTGELIDILKSQFLLYESDGAMVVNVACESDNSPMPPVIIKKTDGSSNYATTDIATLLQRQKHYSPDRIWYFVDQRQALHFTQVFRCAQKAGIVSPQTELAHLGFGTMNGNDGKPFKTRDGGVMRLSDFLNAVSDCAYAKLKAQPEKYRRKIADKLAVAAIKFGDMANSKEKDYIFDIDKFVSFEGKTGIYLLYTVTRINSILEKCKASQSDGVKLTGVYSESERNLLLSIIASVESYQRALDEKALNYICDSAYKIACAFSGFYHENYIYGESDINKRNTWLGLCIITKRCLQKQLEILGIEIVDSM